MFKDNRLIRYGLLSLLLALYSTNSFGQSSGERRPDDDIQTLFDPASSITGFGGIDARFTQVMGQEAIMAGASGGVIFDGHFLLGAGAVGLVSRHTFPGTSTPEDLDLEMGYAGLLLGANIAPHKLIHLSIPVLIGAGNAELSLRQPGGWDIDDVHFASAIVENSAFLVMEPAIHVEINATRFLKFGIGGGYRVLHGINFDNDITNGDLSNWTGLFTVVFGRFL